VFKKIEIYLLYVLVIIAGIEIYLLAKKCSALDSQLNLIESTYLNLNENPKTIHSEKTVDMKAFLFEIDSISDANYLVFFFSADCNSCNMICKKWNNLYVKNNKNMRILGVTYSGVKEIEDFKRRNEPLFDIVKLKKKYVMFHQSPQTILLVNEKVPYLIQENDLDKMDLVKLM
jgi:hypothetical protein